jgi:hypothetical protein
MELLLSEFTLWFRILGQAHVQYVLLLVIKDYVKGVSLEGILCVAVICSLNDFCYLCLFPQNSEL